MTSPVSAVDVAAIGSPEVAALAARARRLAERHGVDPVALLVWAWESRQPRPGYERGRQPDPPEATRPATEAAA